MFARIRDLENEKGIGHEKRREKDGGCLNIVLIALDFDLRGVGRLACIHHIMSHRDGKVSREIGAMATM